MAITHIIHQEFASAPERSRKVPRKVPYVKLGLCADVNKSVFFHHWLLQVPSEIQTMPFWRPVQHVQRCVEQACTTCTIWPNKWGVEMSWGASNRCRNHGREGTWKDHLYNVSSDFKCLRQFIKETVSWSISTVLAVRVSTTKAQRTANKRIQMKLLLSAEVFPSVWRKGFYTKIPIPEWSPRNFGKPIVLFSDVQRGLDRGSEASWG